MLCHKEQPTVSRFCKNGTKIVSVMDSSNLDDGFAINHCLKYQTYGIKLWWKWLRQVTYWRACVKNVYAFKYSHLNKIHIFHTRFWNSPPRLETAGTKSSTVCKGHFQLRYFVRFCEIQISLMCVRKIRITIRHQLLGYRLVPKMQRKYYLRQWWPSHCRVHISPVPDKSKLQ